MKKLLILASMLWSAFVQAQFVPGQVLTAAELNNQFALYSKLAGATFTGPVTIPGLTLTASSSLGGVTSTTTQGFLDNSTLVATDAFVKQTVLAATAEIPIANFTGGTYNFATAGSGAQIVVLVSGGAIQSVLTVAVPGSGYQVGDCLVMVGGNGDAILRVTSLSGSGVAGASVVYGGTGYTTGAQLAAMGLPPGSRTANLTGTLTSNALIIIPSGTFLQGARRIGFSNNTTGAFTTTVKLSNGSGGSTGTGVVLPQGSNNSTSILLYTDGVTDVWPETGTLLPGTIPLSNLAAQAANTVVANATGSSTSPTAVSVPSCSTASSALQWTSGTGPGCNTAINASSLGGTAAASYALLASPTFTGTPAAPTAVAGTNTTQLATTAFTNTIFASPPCFGCTTAAAVHGTTIQATSTITPSTTAGIVGTTLADNANAGSVGEYVTATGTTVPMTTGTQTNITSINLTAGDWDVTGNIQFAAAGTTTGTFLEAGVSSVSATLPGIPALSDIAASFPAGFNTSLIAPVLRINVNTTATVYLVALANFSVSTLTCTGFIRARRVR